MSTPSTIPTPEPPSLPKPPLADSTPPPPRPFHRHRILIISTITLILIAIIITIVVTLTLPKPTSGPLIPANWVPTVTLKPVAPLRGSRFVIRGSDGLCVNGTRGDVCGKYEGQVFTGMENPYYQSTMTNLRNVASGLCLDMGGGIKYNDCSTVSVSVNTYNHIMSRSRSVVSVVKDNVVFGLR
ncbi:hypothetical protein BC829DRAFT_492859 [Chytridium lagenaria]|nr:hypothetical protein BC829DRAFT_492859 [Chytridium lagenaria]